MRLLLMLSFFCAQLLFSSDLSQHLTKRGYYLTPSGTSLYEGYISSSQKEAYITYLQSHPEIYKIAEVGFNAGHTSEIFLEYAKGSQVVSFDINSHAYTDVGVEFIKGKYHNRFKFIEGDSRYSVPEYSKSNRNEKFDLIYIDGCHLFEVCLEDIVNFRSLAHKNSILWVDDTNFPDVQRAVELAERLHIIEILTSTLVEDDAGVRAWVEARYRFKSSNESSLLD